MAPRAFLIRSFVVTATAGLLAACASGRDGRDVQAVREATTVAQVTQRPQRQRTSDRCYTPATNCVMNDPKPVGAPCWCATPFGPSYGEVR